MATTGSPLSAAALERDLHLGEVEEGLENQEIDAGVLQQPDLLGDVVAGIAEQVAAFALDELRARHAAGDEGSGRPPTSLASSTAAALIASVCAP